MGNFTIVISAPSGAGKTTLINHLLTVDSRFMFSISTTTRTMRDCEVCGKSYDFVDLDEFEKLIEEKQFLEWARVHGNYYGTKKKEIDRIRDAGKIPVLDVDVQGAKKLKNELRDAVYVFIVPPSRQILEERLRKRKTDSDEQIKIRLGNSFDELRQYKLYDYIVINNDLDEAVEELESIVTAELCKKMRKEYIINEILEVKN